MPYPLSLLQLGTDPSLLDPKSDGAMRMRSYTKLLSNLSIIVMTSKQGEWREGPLEVRGTGGRTKLQQALRALALARELARTQRYTTVASQDPLFIGLIATMIAHHLRAKLLVSVFGMNVLSSSWLRERWTNRFKKPLGLFVLSRADAVQTDTHASLALLEGRYGKKAFYKPVVPSDLPLFVTERSFKDEGMKVLFVGRLYHEKNIPLLVSTIQESLRRAPRLRFTVIGDGPLRVYFLREIERAGVAASVTYLPSVPRSEMPTYFKKADMLILTSYYEGMAKVFMEAGTSSLPIVTTDVGGARDLIVDGESGFIVPQGDAGMFAERISELAGDSALRMRFGTALGAKARTLFNFDAMIEAQRNVYEHLA